MNTNLHIPTNKQKWFKIFRKMKMVITKCKKEMNTINDSIVLHCFNTYSFHCVCAVIQAITFSHYPMHAALWMCSLCKYTQSAMYHLCSHGLVGSLLPSHIECNVIHASFITLLYAISRMLLYINSRKPQRFRFRKIMSNPLSKYNW